MDFVLDLPQASSGEGFQVAFEHLAVLGPDRVLGFKGLRIWGFKFCFF